MPMTAASAYAKYLAKAGASQDATLQQAAMKPLLEAIIEEIQSNAVVAVSVVGVTTGGATVPATGTVS